MWKLYKAGLRDRLRAPLDRWMATRLVRLFPVVLALYEKVKARRRQLDQLDLLVKLRDLLAKDKAARGAGSGVPEKSRLARYSSARRSARRLE